MHYLYLYTLCVLIEQYIVFQVPPISPSPQRQPSIGNVLARTSSVSSGSPPSGVTRQSSQSSLLEHFASQAKELVRETTRQSSQEGLLAHVDKVIDVIATIYYKVFLCKCVTTFSFDNVPNLSLIMVCMYCKYKWCVCVGKHRYVILLTN